MKKYKVTAAFTTYATLEVNANSAEEAQEIASNTDGGDFITVDEREQGDFKITNVEQVN